MGWTKGTEIMDAAVSAMTMTAAEVFQVASGMENVRTPALGNWLIEEPSNRAKLDDMMRRGVTKVAALLLENGWDSPQEADAFDRFSQEMLGYDDQRYEAWLREHLAESMLDGTSDQTLTWSIKLKNFLTKTGRG